MIAYVRVATISNTSPLLNLAVIGRLELVQAQFEHVVVPPAVVEEFRFEEGRPGSSVLRQAVDEWITVLRPSDEALVRTLRQDLDQGESEAIALAVEKEADLILLDEREGRRRARNLGLEITGALGVLARADREGEVDSLSDALDRLENEAGFWIGSALREEILNGSE